jgi:hypothetical protein
VASSAPGLRAARLQVMSFRGLVVCARSVGSGPVAENKAAFVSALDAFRVARENRAADRIGS